MKVKTCDKCIRYKSRTEEEKKQLVIRLNKIEGQIKGIKKMVEEDRYCNDILIQLSAINKSIKSLGSSLLKSHLSSCISEEIKAGNNAAIEEIMDLFRRLE